MGKSSVAEAEAEFINSRRPTSLIRALREAWRK